MERPRTETAVIHVGALALLRHVCAFTIIAVAAPTLQIAASTPSDELTRARALHQTGDLVNARFAYQKAEESATTAKDGLTLARSLLGLSQIDLSLGHYSQCIALGNDAASRFRALPNPNAANRNEEARALTAVGQARYFAGDSAGALKDFDVALDISRKTFDRQSEVTRLNNIGNVYFALGRFGEALARYNSAENVLAKAPTEPWFASRRQLTSANLAVLYQTLGEYQHALEIYQQMGADPQALPTGERAQMLSNIGTLYRRMGDPVSALEQYRSAQSLYHASALNAGELAALNNVGIALALDLKKPTEAIDAFTRALRLAEESGAKRFMMTSLLYRAEALLLSGKVADAASDFEASRAIAEKLQADEEKWRGDYGLARVAAARGKLSHSDELLRQSIAAIERMRKSTSRSLGRSGFLIERRDVYDLLIEHLASNSSPDVGAILLLMEQSRARDLQDQLSLPILPIRELQARLPADTLLAEYWLGARSLAVVTVSKSKYRLCVKQLSAASSASLQQLPGILSDVNRLDWRAKAAEISALVLTGVVDPDGTGMAGQPGLKHLLIVPDGELARIPLEALPFQKGLLIDHATVTYLPFASALGTVQTSHVTARRWVPPWERMLIAFANPAQGAGDIGTPLESQLSAKLPDAETEVRNAAISIGGRAEIYLGREARKTVLNQAIAPASPILHFATHAIADLEDPQRSYILFANQQRGFDYLFLREAASLSAAKGSLVTVSACDSGVGKLARGEGIQNFGAAFLAAGAKAVITSLWRVGDRPSAELMSRFYKLLARGETATDALRDAKLTFRQSAGSAAHPAHWASFVLTGNGTAQIPKVFSWASIAAAVLAFLAAIAFIIAGVNRPKGTVPRSQR